jgi:hypothetical protein
MIAGWRSRWLKKQPRCRDWLRNATTPNFGTGPGDAAVGPHPSLAPTQAGAAGLPRWAQITACLAAILASWSLAVGLEHVEEFSQGEICEDEFVLAGEEGSRHVSCAAGSPVSRLTRAFGVLASGLRRMAMPRCPAATP